MARDPICGMTVAENSAIRVTKDGKDYFFCSSHCKDRFIQQEKIDSAAVCYPVTRKPIFKNKLFLIFCICTLLILSSFVIPFLRPFRQVFLVYLKTIWWAVLLGLFLGGIVDYYIPQEYISKGLARKRPSTIFNAVFLGFLMSVCSHGILALSIQLHKKGASNPAVVSFLLASPWANFTITIMLIGFFGLKALFIIFAAIIIAINTGFIFMFLEKKGLIEINKNTVEVAEDFSILNDLKKRTQNYKFAMKTLFQDFKGMRYVEFYGRL